MRMKDEDFDNVINTNLKGSFNFIKTVSKYMIKSKSGKIINISSIVGLMGNAGQTNYAASKAALEIWSKSLAMRVGQTGQRVNIVAPGFVDTDILAGDSAEKRKLRESMVPLGRIGMPADIRRPVSFLANENSSYVTGAVIHVNGGLYLPR